MRAYKRADRVKQVIQQEISQILQFEMKDPRLSSLSVTNVELTTDLREAKIFISSLDTNVDHKECLDGLKRANGFIRGMLGRRLTLKFIPTIQFYFDESLAHQERILALIDEIHRQSDEGDGSY